MVAESILNFIFENRLKPGDSIPTEKEISALLDIGKTSVREGIVELKSAGLLESRQGGRVYVKEINLESTLRPKSSFPLFKFLKMSGKEELDLIATRRILEMAAMKEAIEKGREEMAKTLKDLCKKMSQSQDDLEQFIQYDRAFHKTILLSSGNCILPIIFELLSDLYSRQFWEVSRLPQAMRRALGFHEKMCAAIEKGSTREAVDWLDKHLADMEARFMKVQSEPASLYPEVNG
jgi:GntR family transcriptional regulator, transcriptional repressor for pyruvate dehydrogenase complex